VILKEEADAYEEAIKRAQRVAGSAMARESKSMNGQANTTREEAEEIAERERARVELMEADRRVRQREDEEAAEDLREAQRRAGMNAGEEDDEDRGGTYAGMPKLESWLKAQHTQIDKDRAERDEDLKRERAYEKSMRESREREREAAKLKAREALQKGQKAGTTPIEAIRDGSEAVRKKGAVPPPFMPKPSSRRAGGIPPPFAPKKSPNKVIYSFWCPSFS